MTITAHDESSSSHSDQAKAKKILSIRSLMNQSTIYHRHEERMIRSYALRGDTRPALLRVMSLLPGFSIIVPRYEPSNEHETISTRQLGAQLVPPTTAEFTALSPSTSDLEQMFLENTTTSTIQDSHREQRRQISQPTSSSSIQSAGQAMLATMLAAGAAEFVLALGQQIFKPKNSSRFHRSSPFAFGNPNTAHVSGQVPNLNPGLSSRAWLIAASSTAMMFGTKTYLDNIFMANDEPKNSTHIVSSAVAGVMAVVIPSIRERLATSTTPTTYHPFYHHHPRLGGVVGTPSMARMGSMYAAAGVAYFGTYEIFRQATSIEPKGDKNPMPLRGIALAGAMAGMAQATILTVLRSPTTTFGIAAVGSNPNLLSALLRAAPTHALVFLSYESMRRHGSS